MSNTDLHATAAEALTLFRDKLSGKVIDEARFYKLRKTLAECATAGLPHALHRFGNAMWIGQCTVDKCEPPMNTADQARLVAKFSEWASGCVTDAAERANRRDARSEGQLAAQGAVAASGGAIRKARGKR